MTELTHVPVGSIPPDRFAEVLPGDAGERFLAAAARAVANLEGRVVWNVNSTAHGGGVAEMLRSLLAYARGGGVDARWVAIGGTPEFFQVTKRLHNHLHGSAGDGGDLGPEEHRHYEEVLEATVAQLVPLVAPDDIVIVHDPQPAGLCAPLREAGAHVVWRCHVGVDVPNERTHRAWNFLRPYVVPAEAYVFSRRAFGWEHLDESKVEVIAPSIDAFSAKNQELAPEAVSAILSTTGLSPDGERGAAVFVREDGTPGRVDRQAEVVQRDTIPADAPVVLQVSRWDRLKDPIGVIRGFVDHVEPGSGAHLVYAGPAVEAVADDPEGAEVLAEVRELWEALTGPKQERVHLVCLPMDDDEENAAMVNALQRRADIVVQKSIAEGFGLTVAEAMWKQRPVVASRIGGIQDQITDGESGVLLPDPTDLEDYGAAVSRVLGDRPLADRLARAAKDRVRDQFLGARHLLQYIELFDRLTG
jgi:trehalose synthase